MSSSRSPSRANVQTRFAGSLSDVSIGDLFQTLEMAAKSSQIEFDTDVGRATVWFREREVIDAVCGGVTGADAIYRVAMADEGFFTASFDKQDHPQKFQLAPQRLLMEAARRRDEWLDRVGEGLRPATRLAVVARARAQREGSLGATERSLLDRVGQGVQLVDLIPPGDDEAIGLAKPIRALLDAGVLRIVEAQASMTEGQLKVILPPVEDFWVTVAAAYHFGHTPPRALARMLALVVMLGSLLLGLVWLSGRVILGGQLLGWALILVGHAIAGLPHLPFRRPLLLLCEPLVIGADALARLGVHLDFVDRGRALAERRD